MNLDIITKGKQVSDLVSYLCISIGIHLTAKDGPFHSYNHHPCNHSVMTFANPHRILTRAVIYCVSAYPSSHFAIHTWFRLLKNMQMRESPFGEISCYIFVYIYSGSIVTQFTDFDGCLGGHLEFTQLDTPDTIIL